MSDIHTRSQEEYEKAGKIIRVLIDAKLINGDSEHETYSNVWDAAFKILDLNKEE